MVADVRGAGSARRGGIDRRPLVVGPPRWVGRARTTGRRPADDGTLTHELAHALAGVTAGHDGWFRAAHIDVVALLAGAGAADDLARAYAAAGLTIGDRRWPSPVRGVGDGFAIIP